MLSAFLHHLWRGWVEGVLKRAPRNCYQISTDGPAPVPTVPWPGPRRAG